MSPPTASMSSAMERALLVGVPLNNRCSKKCEIPAWLSRSSRDPVPTQKPTVAETVSGIASVTRRMPHGRTLVSIIAASELGLCLAPRSSAAPWTTVVGRARGLDVGRPEVAEVALDLCGELVLEGDLLHGL